MNKITNFNIREDWTLFHNLNTLTQKAGVPKQHLLAKLVAKELADNALYVCPEVECQVGKGFS